MLMLFIIMLINDTKAQNKAHKPNGNISQLFIQSSMYFYQHYLCLLLEFFYFYFLIDKYELPIVFFIKLFFSQPFFIFRFR